MNYEEHIELIDFKHFTLTIITKTNKEKVFIKIDNPDIHYTLHFGMKSKVVDIHITDENFPEGLIERNKPVFKMQHFTIRRIAVILRSRLTQDLGIASLFTKNWKLKVPNKEMQKMFFERISKYRINLGLLRKYDTIAFPIGKEVALNSELFYLTKKKHKSKLKFQDRIEIKKLKESFIDFTDKSIELPDGVYVLSRFGQARKLINNGLLFALTVDGKRRYYHCSRKNYNSVFRYVNNIILYALDNVQFGNKEVVIEFLKLNRQVGSKILS